nr:hypothetical protein [Phycisphaerae bacterium]
MPLLLLAEEEAVFDFSGGLVNSVINAKLQNNQAIVFENFDVGEYGALVPRKGMSGILPNEPPVVNVYNYSSIGHRKEIFLYRLDISLRAEDPDPYYQNDTVAYNVGLLFRCNESFTACSQVVYQPLYYPFRNKNIPFLSRSLLVNDKLLISSSFNPMLIYDGEAISHNYLPSAHEIRTVPLNGAGNLTGTFRYKYCYYDHPIPPDTLPADTSNLSAASFPIEVINGKVALLDIEDSWNEDIDSIFIYREKDFSQNWVKVGSIKTVSPWLMGEKPYEFVDNLSERAVTDTISPYLWGKNPAPYPGCYSISGEVYPPSPPGGLEIEIDYAPSAGGIFSGFEPYYFSESCACAGYSVVYVDKYGVQSSPAALTYRPVYLYPGGSLDTNLYAVLHNIPIPRDTARIKSKIIYRWLWPYDVATPPAYANYYYAGTIDAMDSTFTDAGPPGGILLCDSTEDNFPQLPESVCVSQQSVDSSLKFNPSDLIYFKNRLFAIGDPYHKNRLYFSDFNDPLNWPYDKFIEIPSEKGDWFVRMASIGDVLFLFRQGSIVAFSGITFYQYNIWTISNELGISSPNSLIYAHNTLYFLHNKSLYGMDGGGNIQPIPLSEPIRKSLDSISYKNLVWGDCFNNQIWLSVPINSAKNNRTYIYELDKGYWKCYNFGIKDAIATDYHHIYYDYNSAMVILVRDNDSLYRWNYPPNDTIDHTTYFHAIYQSKYFFEGPERERIDYVDI